MDVREHTASVRRLVHEFNNLLFVIGGHCELLTHHCAGSPQAQADLAADLFIDVCRKLAAT